MLSDHASEGLWNCCPTPEPEATLRLKACETAAWPPSPKGSGKPAQGERSDALGNRCTQWRALKGRRNGSIPYIPIVVRHLVLSQQSYEFLLERHGAMVIFLLRFFTATTLDWLTEKDA